MAVPLSSVAIVLRQTGASFATIREVIALGDGAPARPSALPLAPSGPTALALEQVSFSFPGSASGLCDISLSLPPDQVVVIVGANGSGKSTLARVMAGRLCPNHGRVWVGDADLATISPEHRCQRILYVPQFISLFNRSLADNGLYLPARHTRETLAERLQAWRFDAEGRPADLGAHTGEHGSKLSGGQVQKLELARLCALDAPILILDESTSALDLASETEIICTLRARFAGRLLILVSHRRALAEAADQVVFLHAGHLRGVDRHSTLMARADYRALWGGLIDPDAPPDGSP